MAIRFIPSPKARSAAGSASAACVTPISEPARVLMRSSILRAGSSPPPQMLSAEMPRIRWSGRQVITRSIDSSSATSMRRISSSKSSSELTGSSGMCMREMWLVTPLGAIAS